jgi:multicomponent Na+:H+ antiporter subunit A
LLWPENNRYIENTTTVWKISRVTTSKMMERRSGASVRPPGSHTGRVAGLALMVRYRAGGRYELDEAAPIEAGALLGIGLFIATGSGLAPLLFGGAVLQSAILDLHLPLLGDVHLVTSLGFDAGVYVVVVGLVLDLLRSLGSGIDRQILADERQEVGSR